MNPVIQTEYLFLLTLLVLAAAFYLGRISSAKVKPGRRILIAVVRLVALAGLALILFNPGSWQREQEDKGQEWILMVDRSSSMAVKDLRSESRWSDVAGKALKLSNAAKEKQIPVKTMSFSSSLENEVDDLKSLEKNVKPDGQSTNLFLAGRELLDRCDSSGKKIRGIVFLTDARQIADEKDRSFSIRALSSGIPVYVSLSGGTVLSKDISVTSDRRDYLSFCGQKLMISATVKNSNAGDIVAELALGRLGGEKIASKKISIPNNSSVPCIFEFQTTKAGSFQYELSISAPVEDANPENNRAFFAMTVSEQKLKILMVEGLPFWDSKFFAQLLRGEKNMELNAIYRLSTDHFFRVDSNNDTTSESQQPIFPDTIEELLSYNLLVFGRGIEYFLDEDRIRLLKKYVSDYGGAILFARGKPYSGEFPELEPFEPFSWGEPIEEEFTFNPTATGDVDGIFGGVLPGRDDPAWKKLPPIDRAWRPGRMKTFTETLCEGIPVAGNRERGFPILANLKYGRGVVAVNNCEGLWKWDFAPLKSSDSAEFYKEYWLQTVQWLIRFSDFLPGKSFSMRSVNSSVFPGETLIIKIESRLSPDTKVDLALSSFRDGKKVFETIPQKTPSANAWQSLFSFNEPGPYIVRLDAKWGDKTEELNLPVFVKTPLDEKSNLSADPDFAEAFAVAAGGRRIEYGELEKTVLDSAADHAMNALESESVWMPKWCRWWFLSLILLFLGAEYFVRRRGGLL